VEAGDKSKPLVLLLHGFPDCWLSWREQIPCLAEHYRFDNLCKIIPQSYIMYISTPIDNRSFIAAAVSAE